MEMLEEIAGYRFRNVTDCSHCGYRDDCREFWTHCPYDGKLVVEKRRDDAEVF